MPLISVIIPVYNRLDLLRRALSSLSLQTFTFFDFWICDDESSEDVLPVISEYESALDIKVLNISYFGGPARPRNAAIKHSRSQYLAFLDSEDY